MDDISRIAANHPLILIAAAVILILVLMKSFNKLE